MKYGIRERLIGAGVLIFLAIVFIPLFLGNRLDDLPLIQPEQMPPKPTKIEVKVNPFTQPPEVYEIGDEYLDKEMLLEDSEISSKKREYAEQLPVENNVVDKEDNLQNSSNAKADIENLPNKSKPEVNTNEVATTEKITADKEQKSIQIQKTGGGKMWSIQTASFSDFTKARKYLGKLEKLGFSGYWRNIKGLGVVFVGPFTNYEDAKTSLAKLESRYAQKRFFIVKYINDFTAAKFGTLPEESMRKSIK